MDLSNIAKSESPSKLLTPWWDVGIYYAIRAMLILSVAAIGLQTTKDGLVCLPAVDCGAAFERNQQSVRNANPSNDTLNACRKLKLPGKERPSGTVVLTTMEDRRQYDYVDHKCYAQIPIFPRYFSLIFLGETLFLLIISDLWLKYTKTSCTLSHFENLLSEFNHFELKACESLAINPHLGDTDELKIKVCTFAYKVFYFKEQYMSTEYSHDSLSSLTFQYRFRFDAGMLSLVAMLCSNIFYFQNSIFSQCRLTKALFLKGHEQFECTRPIAGNYCFMAGSFIGLLVVNFLLFLRAGYWAYKELPWAPKCEIEILGRTEVISGDLAFLFKLIENSSASFQRMIGVGILLTPLLAGENNDNGGQTNASSWIYQTRSFFK